MTVNVCVTGRPRLVVRSVEAALQSHADDSEDGGERSWVVSVEPCEEEPDVVVIIELGAAVPPELEVVHHRYPAAQVVWLAGDPNGGEIAEAVARGCSTVVTGRSDLDDLVNGVTMASHGEAWTSPELVAELMNHLRSPRTPDRGGLSPREVQVLSLLRDGRTTTDIAAELFISLHTAKNHVRRILRKLGAHSRLEAVAIADRRQLLDPLV